MNERDNRFDRVVRVFAAVLGGVLLALALFLALPAATWESLGLSARVVPPLRQAASRDTGLEQSVKDVVRKVGPAVVKVTTTTETVVENFFFRLPEESEGVGSGVIIDSKGLVLTNNHVVAGAKRIDVFLSDGRHFRGRVRGADPWSDLAVLQLESVETRDAAGSTRVERLPVAKLADSDKLEVGQFVVAIGNPFRFDHSVTLGVISALERTLPVVPEGGEVPAPDMQGPPSDTGDTNGTVGTIPVYLEGLIQTDASINPGNSGGPLLDTSGNVVGIATAILQPIQGITPNIGFAIPINRAMDVAKQLLAHGRVLRLGVVGGTLTPEIASALEEMTGHKLPVEKGAYVVQIIPKSPAEKVELQPNDVIVLANGKRIESMEELVAIVKDVGFGGSLEVGFYRRGERRSVRVSL